MNNKIKELRKKKKLTQEELAQKINVTKLTISRWERGERLPKSDKAQELADFFGVTIPYLLGFIEEREYSAGTTDYDDTKNKELLELGRDNAKFLLQKRNRTLEDFEKLIQDNSSFPKIGKYDEEGIFSEVDTTFLVHQKIIDLYNLLALAPSEYGEIILNWSCLSSDERRKILDMLNALIDDKFNKNQK
ncbi:helix-turn-helix domain-containing protein [Streptococcus lutetiensis]|uniref:helix-turn-helix domain-containing protein n=2 Tax=Streptococcus lutetiensis TaxID=150055 RepID=UPI001BDA6FD7|nr:helix-turn-helix domain-containing protein [Streptococcus lutetiensis]MBT0923492.1 helix-turn-helix domain-containing protein [Streptococcus lutetiensis]